MTPDQLSVVVRALALAAIFQATGAAFFLAIFTRWLTRAWEPIRRLGRLSALTACLLVLAHLTLDAARLSGDFDGLRDWDLQRLAWTSKSGISQGVQAGGLIALYVALRRRGPGRLAWAGACGVMVCAGFLLTGHTSHHPWRIVLAPLLALHLFIVAFWFGSLLPLLLVIRLETPPTTVDLLHRFSRLAVWLVPLILVAGVAMAGILTGGLDVLRRPYGELLLAKAGAFGLLMLLAARNQWRLAPALARGGSAGPLRRSIAVEYGLIVAVLTVTAVLTAFYSPK